MKMLKSIKYVAVVTLRKRDFKEYSEDNKCIGTEYKHIQSLEDLRGITFSRRVLIGAWRDVKDLDEILSELAVRIII